MRTALFLAIRQRVTAASYRRLGTNYRSHIQWSRSYYAASSGIFLQTFRYNLSVPSSWVKTLGYGTDR